MEVCDLQNLPEIEGGQAMSKCNYEGHDRYPTYGIAPHIHDLSKTGSFIGSTKIKPKSEWPPNFVEDTAPGEEGMGVYYCPKCLEGKPYDHERT
jgi:hypothetical protein